MEYRVICGTLDNLVGDVNSAIADGWTLQGGVCHWGENTNDQHIHYGYSLFAQAMVKSNATSLEPGMEVLGKPGERLEGFNPND